MEPVGGSVPRAGRECQHSQEQGVRDQNGTTAVPKEIRSFLISRLEKLNFEDYLAAEAATK